MTSRQRTWLVLLLLAPATASAQGQTLLGPGCTGPGGGTVVGVVVDSAAARPLPRRAVTLTDPACRTLSDSAGTFMMTGVPPGARSLTTGTLGFRRGEPIPVMVVADDTVHVRILMRPAGQLQECREAPECAAVLAPLHPPGAGDDALFRIRAFQTGFGLAWIGVGRPAGLAACVEDADGMVLAALQGAHAGFEQRELCDHVRPPGGGLARVRHLGTQEHAVILSIRDVTHHAASRREALISYSAGMLWMEGWLCTFERRGADWDLVGCRLHRVS
jgi:hypothetical protein